jgi:hypothetical protein
LGRYLFGVVGVIEVLLVEYGVFVLLLDGVADVGVIE